MGDVIVKPARSRAKRVSGEQARKIRFFLDENPGPEWLKLSAAFTKYVERISERYDLRVTIAPLSPERIKAKELIDEATELLEKAEAAHAFPSVDSKKESELRLQAAELVKEALALVPYDDIMKSGLEPIGIHAGAVGAIEVNGPALLPKGVLPKHLNPRMARDRIRMPKLMGAVLHEVGHAKFSDCHFTNGMAKECKVSPSEFLDWVNVLEDVRMEFRLISENPTTRRWLRSMAGKLLDEALEGVEDLATIKALGSPSKSKPAVVMAARTAILTVGRSVAGILDEDETEGIYKHIKEFVGQEAMDELIDIIKDLLDVPDGAASEMTNLVQRVLDWIRDSSSAFPEGELDLRNASKGLGSDEEAKGSSDSSGGGEGSPTDPSSSSEAEAKSKEIIGKIVKLVQDAAEKVEEAAQQEIVEAESGDDGSRQKEIENALNEMAKREDMAAFGKGSFDSAARVFPKTKTGVTLPERPPSVSEVAIANQLTTVFRNARLRDRSVVNFMGETPPGRLSVGRAIAYDAAESRGIPGDPNIWQQSRRRHVESPILTVGLAVDVSGSMSPVCVPSAVTSWALGRAVTRSGGRFASVLFGENVYPVVRPGQVINGVPIFVPGEAVEQADSAIKTLNGALNLTSSSKGARMLFIVTDANFVIHGEMRRVVASVGKLADAGCHIIHIALKSQYPLSIDGTSMVLINSPRDLPKAIGGVITEILKAA